MGLITYDTSYDDRVYLIHTSSEKSLLERMIDTVLEAEGPGAVMKVNAKDAALCRTLREKGFQKKHRCGSVLSLDLSNSLEYDLPDAYAMSPRGFVADPWQYQLVIHRGFDNDGIPEKWEDAFLKRIPHGNEDLKTFAIAHNEYCAHCGLWYTTGVTAYVEPVATVPEQTGAWRKRPSTKPVRVQRRLAQSAPLFCRTRSFISESVLRFPRKCTPGGKRIPPILIDRTVTRGRFRNNHESPAAKCGRASAVL